MESYIWSRSSLPVSRWQKLKKRPMNQKVYRQMQRADSLMILDLVRSGASSISLRKLCKSASIRDGQQIKNVNQITRSNRHTNQSPILPHLAYKRNVQLSKRRQHFHISTCLFPCFPNCPFCSWLTNFHVTSRKCPMSKRYVHINDFQAKDMPSYV